MRIAAFGMSALLAAAVGVAGCTNGDTSEPPPTRARVIDETRGAYRGVRLGSAPAEVHRVFGHKAPAGENEPVTPLEGDSHGASSIPYSGGPCPAPTYRYEHVAFGFNCGKLLSIETTEPGAATARGVAVGDPLALVDELYPEAVCGKAGGGEHEEYPACSARLAPRRFIWFGGDPITTIELGAAPLEGVDPDEPFTGRVFTLGEGDVTAWRPGEISPRDKIVCVAEGERIEVFVPRADTAVSTESLYVETELDGRVRAECGGTHADTAPGG